MLRNMHDEGWHALIKKKKKKKTTYIYLFKEKNKFPLLFI